MKIDLVCSEKYKRIITEILATRNISVSKDAEIRLIENNDTLQDGKLEIHFNILAIDQLADFLDTALKNNDMIARIIGKRENGDLKVLDFNDIYYFEALGNNVYCQTRLEKLKIKEKLYDLENQLQSKEFIRVNKSYIVNITKVDRIIPWFNSKLILKLVDLEQQIDVTRKYLSEFRNYLNF